MSDLHLDLSSTVMDEDTQTDADVLVLAGDIVALRDWHWYEAGEILRGFAKRYPAVVYVPGNHEYYGTRISAVDLHELQNVTGVHVLHPDAPSVHIGQQRFVGGTLFQPADPVASKISDHSQIRGFTSEAAEHFGFVEEFLNLNLRPSDIVVTHHAPCNGSIAPEYVGNPWNRWFITPEMEPLILDHQPKLWIHGHVHSPHDYMLGKTRIVCNPRGYRGEGVKFNPKLVIEIS